jgi:hypothetical protein
LALSRDYLATQAYLEGMERLERVYEETWEEQQQAAEAARARMPWIQNRPLQEEEAEAEAAGRGQGTDRRPEKEALAA